MGLKKKVGELATQSAQDAIKTYASSLNMQNSSQTSSQPFVTTVVRIKGPTSFVVLDATGNEITVDYIGDRSISPGGTIVLDSGFAR